jgi:pimeloyl-ACP methyl ester carboxylesterase
VSSSADRCMWALQVVVAGYLEGPVGVPVFLGGLSMGGLVAAVTALHSPGLWQVGPLPDLEMVRGVVL